MLVPECRESSTPGTLQAGTSYAPLPIAPVVTAVFRDGSDCEVPCDICDPDRAIPMGMTKRFTAAALDGRETKQRGGVLYQVHVSLVE